MDRFHCTILYFRYLRLCPIFHSVVTLLDPNESTAGKDQLRIDAAHIISSISLGESCLRGQISYLSPLKGSVEALRALLTAQALQALLYAISKFKSTDSIPLKSAIVRAFRSLAVACAEVVGPPLWGLPVECPELKAEAKSALDSIFQREHLDIYMPLLGDTNLEIVRHNILMMLASCVRLLSHQSVILDWCPLTERAKPVSTRGWEKPSPTRAITTPYQWQWIIRQLTLCFEHNSPKVIVCSCI
jgi:hypothetical protein